MNDLDEFTEVALAIFVALTLLIWLLTYLERTISRPLTEKRTRRGIRRKRIPCRPGLPTTISQSGQHPGSVHPQVEAVIFASRTR
jgi:hypothetical protein